MDRGLVRDQKEGGVGEPLPEERQKPDGERVVEPPGVGEHSAFIRQRVCKALGFLGITLDDAANAADAPLISAAGSPVIVGVEPTNEEWVAARSALSVLATSAPGPSPTLLPMHEES